jgi:hypothetical protein
VEPGNCLTSALGSGRASSGGLQLTEPKGMVLMVPIGALLPTFPAE